MSKITERIEADVHSARNSTEFPTKNVEKLAVNSKNSRAN